MSDFSPSFSSINEEYLESVDISSPLILAEIAPGRYNLIDGHHRLELVESKYWFELLEEGGIAPEKKLKRLMVETDELIAIFVTIIKNTKKNNS